MATMHFAAVAVVATLAVNADVASAQNYPSKPVRIFASEPGNILEIAARVIAQEINGPLGQPVIVENRPSAILPDMLSRATPDGYTVSIGSGVFWLTPLIQKTSYDVIKDFAPITIVETYPHMLVVHPSTGAKTVKELIDLAKAKPGVLNMAATASPGGQSYLSAELFKAMAGVNIVRVPFKGNAQGLVSLLAGEVNLMFNDWVSVMPHVKAGKLNALAVGSLQPFPYAPGLPTLSASGLPGYESLLIAGVLAPAGTPPPIIARLNQEMVRALRKPEVKERFPMAEVVGSTPEQFGAKIKSEMVKWGKVLKEAGVKPEL